MDSKLARRMAYKKKLEEEYRQFQERCQVRDWRNLTDTQIYSSQSSMRGRVKIFLNFQLVLLLSMTRGPAGVGTRRGCVARSSGAIRRYRSGGGLVSGTARKLCLHEVFICSAAMKMMSWRDGDRLKQTDWRKKRREKRKNTREKEKSGGRKKKSVQKEHLNLPI